MVPIAVALTLYRVVELAHRLERTEDMCLDTLRIHSTVRVPLVTPNRHEHQPDAPQLTD